MKTMIRWTAVMLAALMMTLAAALGLCCLTTTQSWAQRALTSETLQARQQSRIDEAAEELAARLQVSPEVLTPCTEGAAAAYTDVLAAWWGSLWQEEYPDTALPLYLTSQEEKSLIAAVMADPMFAEAHDGASLRAIARDEVAYGLDEIVAGTVLPLRRSVTELALTMLQERFGMAALRRSAAVCGGLLAGAALLLTALNRRSAGVTLIASGGMMALASIPVWLLDLHGMLRALNGVAALQGDCVLLWLAIPWYGAALLMMSAGAMIIRVRNGRI